MAKTTKAAGASYTQHELSDPEPSQVAQDIVEGGESESVGISSSASEEKPHSDDNGQEATDRDPAPTTENPSSRTARADSGAASTGGSGRVTGKGSRSKTSRKGGASSTEDDDVPDEFKED